MNAKSFEKLIKYQLLPALPKKSLIIMDNASYHSVREDGTKAPASNTRKGEMIYGSKANKIPFNENSKKPELYEIPYNR